MKHFKDNNKGSTLILVIICMGLVAVLASIVLTLTLKNVEIRSIEADSAVNFYSTEGVIDEIITALDEEANEALKEAYQNLLQNYASYSVGDRKEKFLTEISNLLYARLIGYFGSGYMGSYEEIIPGTYGTNWALLENRSDLDSITWGSTPDVVTGENCLIIKGLSITYDDSGYKTTITTDIRIDLTFPSFLKATVESGTEFLDYAIIAGDNISNATDALTTVNGNIYSAASLKITGGLVQISAADYIITQTAVDVTRGGQLRINGTLGSYTNLWTNNIMTTPFASNLYSDNVINMNYINCHIKDDLSINGKGDSVTITNGNYYGYSTIASADTVKDANDSSAITVNGTESKLILALDTLWIAGNSYIAVPEGYGSGATGAELGDDAPTYILEGDSLAFKGNQAAYLLPGDCLVDVGHNPMTQEEYDIATNYDSVTGSRDSLNIDIYLGESVNGMPLQNYLLWPNPGKAVMVKYKEQTMVYVYMTFISEKRASEYFNDYYLRNGELVESRIATLGTGSISVSCNNRVTAGNVITVKQVLGNIETTILEKTIDKSEGTLNSFKISETGKFGNLVKSLSEETRYRGTGTDVFDNIFDVSKIAEIAGDVVLSEDYKGDYKVVAEVTSGEAYAFNGYVSETGVAVATAKGLFLIDGDVTVPATLRVDGLIIATGKVTLENGSEVTANHTEILNLIEADTTGILKSFFAVYTEASGAAETTQDVISIGYENWTKN